MMFFSPNACGLWFLLMWEVEGMVDVNLAELEYIANHLTVEECRQLYRALHSKDYELSPAHHSLLLDPKTKSCLELLVHWNGAVGEGSGEGHSLLSRRLVQIGKRDLGEWLSRRVFENLSEELNKTILSDPFQDLGLDPETVRPPAEGNNTDLYFYLQQEWDVWDTLLSVAAVAMLVVIAVLAFSLARREVHEKGKGEPTSAVYYVVEDTEYEDEDMENGNYLMTG